MLDKLSPLSPALLAPSSFLFPRALFHRYLLRFPRILGRVSSADPTAFACIARLTSALPNEFRENARDVELSIVYREAARASTLCQARNDLTDRRCLEQDRVDQARLSDLACESAFGNFIATRTRADEPRAKRLPLRFAGHGYAKFIGNR